MEELNKPIEAAGQTVPEEHTDKPAGKGEASETRQSGPDIPLIIAAVLLFIAGLIYLLIWLGPETTRDIRDVSLVFSVLAGVVTIAALAVIIFQVIKLISFLKTEIEPILHTAKRSARQVSGTISFLNENAVGPAKNTAATLAGIKDTADGILSIFRKK